jgi:hypothetical protein
VEVETIASFNLIPSLDNVTEERERERERERDAHGMDNLGDGPVWLLEQQYSES